MLDDLTWDEAQEKLAALGARFSPSDVKQRTQGGMKLDYVSIDATIRRLNEVLGTNWDFNIDRATVLMIPADKAGGKPKYLAQVQGHLFTLESSRGGVGADIADDPDKAFKTAQAEALKKAANQFGIALYLWDETERDHLHLQREAQAGDMDSVKALVMIRAEGEGCTNMTAEGISTHFGIDEDELQDPELLRKLAGV